MVLRHAPSRPPHRAWKGREDVVMAAIGGRHLKKKINPKRRRNISRVPGSGQDNLYFYGNNRLFEASTSTQNSLLPYPGLDYCPRGETESQAGYVLPVDNVPPHISIQDPSQTRESEIGQPVSPFSFSSTLKKFRCRALSLRCIFRVPTPETCTIEVPPHRAWNMETEGQRCHGRRGRETPQS